MHSQARRLEGELEVKLQALTKLCAGFEASYRSRPDGALGPDQVEGGGWLGQRGGRGMLEFDGAVPNRRHLVSEASYGSRPYGALAPDQVGRVEGRGAASVTMPA